MKNTPFEIAQQNTVCGQAHAVLENLARSNDLPDTLGISIEELIEGAWEIAYQRQAILSNDNVIAVPAWTFRAKSAQGGNTLR